MLMCRRRWAMFGIVVLWSCCDFANPCVLWAQAPVPGRQNAEARVAPPVNLADAGTSTKIHPTVARRLAETVGGQPIKAWVLFADKGITDEKAYRTALRNLASTYDTRAIARRVNRRSRPGLLDEDDLPVPARYVDAVAATGVEMRVVSRWVNGVSVLGSVGQFERIARLPFVGRIQPVRRGRKIDPKDAAEPGGKPLDAAGASRTAVSSFYGQSEAQLAQINLIAVHDVGYTGEGVVVGILDTGFQRSHVAFNDPAHPIDVIAEYDFVNDDPDTGIEPGDPSGQHSHGTVILGTLGAFMPGELVGAAYDASFILCKTEDTTGEYPAEEDNYVAGLEFIEQHGGDVATSSLGYIDWYSQDDLNGLTAVTTIAVNVATANGVYCCTAAGNSGHDADPITSRLIAPADALRVLSCGAVDSTGTIASFSSDGPSADGRVKPEVLARGVNTRTVSASNDTDYVGVGGTSLSTPLLAGAVACLVQAHPEWTVDQMRSRLFNTADDFVANQTFDPYYVRGYGVINALGALIQEDCNNNGIDDGIDITTGTSDDTNGNGIPDECEAGACCACPPETGCEDTDLAYCNDLGGDFAEGATCETVTCPSSIPPNDDCAEAVLVTDGTYSFDTRCATTDGPPTATDGCQWVGDEKFHKDIWFKYQAACSGVLSVSAFNTDYDALVAVYCDGSDSCSCPIDGSTEYACNQEGDAGSSVEIPVTVGNCYTIRLGGYNGAAGVGQLGVDCEELDCVSASTPGAEIISTGKSRYISFRAGDSSRTQAVQVTLASLLPPFDIHDGTTMWVGEPFEVSEIASLADTTEPTFTAARLQCGPHFMDWTAVGVVHVFDPAIIPDSIYEIRSVDSNCLVMPTMCFDGYGPFPSDPLIVSTSLWGDVTGGCDVTPCSPPDGERDFVDISAVVDKFKNRPGAPIKSRADLAGELPDGIVDFIDISQVVDAFKGSAYPFAGPDLDVCP